MRFVVCLTALGIAACATGSPPPEGGDRLVAAMPGAGYKGEALLLHSSSELGVLDAVPGPIDSVFGQMAAAYLSLGLDVKTRDPVEHVIGNKQLTVMGTIFHRRLSAFFNCGIDPTVGVPRADKYRVTFSVTSTLTRADDPGKTRITTLVSAIASDLYTSATPVECESTGALERALVHAAGYQTTD
jgi:hypothetical protein